MFEFVTGLIVGLIVGALAVVIWVINGEINPVPKRRVEPLTLDENAGIPTG